MCETGERFLVSHVVVDGDVIIILCSDDGLRVLAEAERWHSDGTFDSAALGFSQLYIIHVLRLPSVVK
jgi:hypothetical protein